MSGGPLDHDPCTLTQDPDYRLLYQNTLQISTYGYQAEFPRPFASYRIPERRR